jgi:hypothetical protein
MAKGQPTVSNKAGLQENEATKHQPWRCLKKLQGSDKNWSNHCTKTVVTANIRILNEFDSTGG